MPFCEEGRGVKKSWAHEGPSKIKKKQKIWAHEGPSILYKKLSKKIITSPWSQMLSCGSH